MQRHWRAPSYVAGQARARPRRSTSCPRSSAAARPRASTARWWPTGRSPPMPPVPGMAARLSTRRASASGPSPLPDVSFADARGGDRRGHRPHRRRGRHAEPNSSGPRRGSWPTRSMRRTTSRPWPAIIGATLSTGGKVEDLQLWPERIAGRARPSVCPSGPDHPGRRRIGRRAARGPGVKDRPDTRRRKAAQESFVLVSLMSGVRGRSIEISMIQTIVSPRGIEAWLVEDYAVPLVAVDFAFRGGAAQDPAGQAGLGQMMASLLDEGAGALDDEAFQRSSRKKRSSSPSRPAATNRGSLRTLADRKERAFDLLRLALDRAALRCRPGRAHPPEPAGGPAPRAERSQRHGLAHFFARLFPDHPYGRWPRGTLGKHRGHQPRRSRRPAPPPDGEGQSRRLDRRRASMPTTPRRCWTRCSARCRPRRCCKSVPETRLAGPWRAQA